MQPHVLVDPMARAPAGPSSQPPPPQVPPDQPVQAPATTTEDDEVSERHYVRHELESQLVATSGLIPEMAAHMSGGFPGLWKSPEMLFFVLVILHHVASIAAGGGGGGGGEEERG